jgi:hypothetical protein
MGRNQKWSDTMPSTLRSRLGLAILSALVAVVLAVPAQAKQICGWYVVAFCSVDQAAADDFAGRGWGSAISTDVFTGFRHGLYCVLSGPQSKSSAQHDRLAALNQGVADDAYIKRACADESAIGD